MSEGKLNADDIIAGSLLFLLGVIGIGIHAVVCCSLVKMVREIVGFRFLLSQAISDILLIFQFGIWPGIVILKQDEIIPPGYRWHVHIYLNFTWWTMVYHHPIIAWSRLAAIQWPNWFRCLRGSTCALICLSVWFIAICQSFVEHQFPWFVPLYYDAQLYGFTTDWVSYNMNGTAAYYILFNVTSIILPLPFYVLSLITLFRRQKRFSIASEDQHTQLKSAIISQGQLGVEVRLLIPCILTAVIFIFRQVAVALCSKYSGKWMSWCVIMLFASNSFANPIVYLLCSSAIRSRIKLCKLSGCLEGRQRCHIPRPRIRMNYKTANVFFYKIEEQLL